MLTGDEVFFPGINQHKLRGVITIVVGSPIEELRNYLFLYVKDSHETTNTYKIPTFRQLFFTGRK
jgi:hypothetical protein